MLSPYQIVNIEERAEKAIISSYKEMIAPNILNVEQIKAETEQKTTPKRKQYSPIVPCSCVSGRPVFLLFSPSHSNVQLVFYKNQLDTFRLFGHLLLFRLDGYYGRHSWKLRANS